MDGISPQRIEIDSQLESGKNIMFKKELLALFGVNNLENAQGTPFLLSPWEELVEDSTTHTDTGEDVAIDTTIYRPQVEKRCQLCHQQINNIVQMRTGESNLFIGVDCAAKLENFRHTGRIESVNLPKRKSEFKTFVEKELRNEDEDKYDEGDLYEAFGEEEVRRGAKKHVFTASMISWANDYAKNNKDTIDKNIVRILKDIQLFEAPQSQEDSSLLTRWYKQTRTLIPDDILTRSERRILRYHPHKSMLEKTLNTPRNANDIHRIVRAIDRRSDHAEKRELEEGKRIRKEEYRKKLAHLTVLLRGDEFRSTKDLENSGDMLFKPIQTEGSFATQREVLKSLFSKFTKSSFEEGDNSKFVARNESGVLHVYMYYYTPDFIIDKETVEIPISESPLLKELFPQTEDVVLHTSCSMRITREGNVFIYDKLKFMSNNIDEFLSRNQ